MTTQVALTVGLAVGYVFVIVGSLGMVVFARRFSFSTNAWGLEHTSERCCGLTGYQVWNGSWWLIVGGSILQLFFSVALALR